jgi:hypothetical protein
VVGQYTNVEHIGIGKYYPGMFSNFSSLCLGGIAIKGSNSLYFKTGAEYILKFVQLVLGQGFGWEKVKGTSTVFV